MSTLSQFFSVGISSSSNINFNPLCANKIVFCKNGNIIYSVQYTGNINDPGGYLEGGHVICKASSVQWVVAPRCGEVSRTWYCINDAITLTESCTGIIGGWFIPTVSQLQNPGYTCRQYWDLFSSTRYWSSTEVNATCACAVCFTTGASTSRAKTNAYCVRAFRCVTY
jgi:hypothetical protein